MKKIFNPKFIFIFNGICFANQNLLQKQAILHLSIQTKKVKLLALTLILLKHYVHKLKPNVHLQINLLIV